MNKTEEYKSTTVVGHIMQKHVNIAIKKLLPNAYFIGWVDDRCYVYDAHGVKMGWWIEPDTFCVLYGYENTEALLERIYGKCKIKFVDNERF